MSSETKLVQYTDILAAREVIDGKVHRTPMVSSSYFGERVGARVNLKLELFQKTGSFKVRGVLNKLQHVSDVDKKKGVITLSAGNHAQALAWAAARSGISATVIMPADGVRSKIEATRGYGGEVILTEGDLLAKCREVQEERDFTLIHPFDDPHIIAGHGTVGVEILEDVPEVDVVVVGVGGGGIISGVAAAIKATKPDTRIIGVEPQGAPAMSLSLDKGEPVYLDKVDSIADGLSAPFVGKHTLAHVQAFVDDMVIVSDDEIRQAMALIIERCKVLAEPAASAGLAALLTGKIQLPKRCTVVCLLSGGNIDRERLKSLL